MELAKKSDYFLVKQINKNASSEAYLELKNRVEKSYYRTLSSYCKKIPQLKYDEMAEQIDEVILKAASSYKKSKKTKFNSWFTNHSRYFILNNVKKLNELGVFSYTDNVTLDLINNENFNFSLDKTGDMKEYVRKLLSKVKDPRTKKIIELRFFNDKSGAKWKNISKELGISIQQCTNLFNDAKKFLYKEIVKNKI